MSAAEFLTLYLKDERLIDKKLKNDDLENLIRIKDELENVAYGETICCCIDSGIEIAEDI